MNGHGIKVELQTHDYIRFRTAIARIPFSLFGEIVLLFAILYLRIEDRVFYLIHILFWLSLPVILLVVIMLKKRKTEVWIDRLYKKYFFPNYYYSSGIIFYITNLSFELYPSTENSRVNSEIPGMDIWLPNLFAAIFVIIFFTLIWTFLRWKFEGYVPYKITLAVRIVAAVLCLIITIVSYYNSRPFFLDLHREFIRKVAWKMGFSILVPLTYAFMKDWVRNHKR